MDATTDRAGSQTHTRRPRVIVGVDGSPDSIAALRAGEWAAAARGGTLVATTAFGVPMVVPRAPVVIPDLHDAAITVQRDALVDAFDHRCVVPVHSLIRAGTAAGVLVEESRDADLLIVGSRGHGGFAGLLIGSVSMACSMHAACPVLVMHTGDAVPREKQEPAPRVVVGVGGGPGASTVLRAAAAAAEEMDAELLAVTAWQDTAMYADTFVDLRDEMRDGAQRNLDERIAETFPSGRPPRLRTEVREGAPAGVLVAESGSADLVVVGRSGRNELAGVLLGSVGLPVAEHAKCPVLVVPVLKVARRREHAGDGLVVAAV